MEQWTKYGDELCLRGIKVNEWNAQSKDNPHIDKEFDLGIFFASFESRALISSKLLKKRACHQTIIIYFTEAKEDKLRVEYDVILKKQVTRCSVNPPKIIEDFSIRDITKIINNIFENVNYKNNNKWFLDIGGAPIPYFLGLMGYLKEWLLPPVLTIFNPTGKYVKSHKMERFSFTAGFCETIWIPRFWGVMDCTLPQEYIFMLGHDGFRSQWLLETCEPDKVQAFLAQPGYLPEHEARALEENKLFMDLVGLTSETILKADAADVVDTYLKLDQLIRKEKGKYNICFAPLGTKAHALACGICALAHNTPAIIYQMPRSFSVRDVPCGETLWLYEIKL